MSIKHKRLGKHGVLVSNICLGTMNFGWHTSEEDSFAIMDRALELGVNFFDTAPNYGRGTSETRLGKALKGIDRSKIVINTKFGHTDSGKTNFSSDYIRESLEGSLSRLQMDYVDSLIIHNPPFEILDGNKNAHYEILELLKEEGKIKAYGASLDTYDEMKLFMETTGGEVIEAFFNILHQDAGRAFDLAREKEVGIIAKIPLDSGWLSGKYNSESTFDDIRARWTREDIKTRAVLVEKVKNIIGEENNLAQTALSFCLAYDAVSTVIPGNTTIDQLMSNLDSLNNPVPSEMVEKLEHFYQNEVKALNLPW